MSEPRGGRLPSAQAFADVAASLVRNDDLADVLLRLLDECGAALAARAAGVMVLVDDHTVEVLSASSHAALELELYQSQITSGPCLDTIGTGIPVAAYSEAELRRRWPEFAEAAIAAGYGGVYAQPMRWHGDVIGGLNIFRVDGGAFDEEERLLARAFADMVTVAIISTGWVSPEQAVLRARAALTSRNVIEQAKGVLAYQADLPMSEAFEELKRLAASTGRSLTQLATELIEQAGRR